MASNRHAIALGRKGGNANTEAQRIARSRNILNGGRPKLYRIVGDVLERHVDGRWLALEPPYDAAAKAFLRRQPRHLSVRPND